MDGDPMSRADAVARCKRTAGAIVVIETNAWSEWEWDPTTCTIVRIMIEDEATKAIRAEWEETRSALMREGVRVYVRGLTGDIRFGRRPMSLHPERRGCEVLPPLVDPVRPVPKPAPESE